MAYGESNGHVIDDVMDPTVGVPGHWRWRPCECAPTNAFPDPSNLLIAAKASTLHAHQKPVYQLHYCPSGLHGTSLGDK